MAFPTTRGQGFQQASFALDLPFIDIVPQGGGGCTQPFKMGCSGRAVGQMHFLQNPTTGAMELFKPAGAIILTRSDLTAARKVKQLAAMASRGTRRRTRKL